MACEKCPYCGRSVNPYRLLGNKPYECPNWNCRRRLVVYGPKFGKLCVRQWPKVVDVKSSWRRPDHKRSKPYRRN